MDPQYKKQLEIIQEKILSNIEQIQKLVKQTEELHDFAESPDLPEDKKKIVEKHITEIRDIISKLTDQTLEMFSAFKKFVK